MNTEIQGPNGRYVAAFDYSRLPRRIASSNNTIKGKKKGIWTNMEDEMLIEAIRMNDSSDNPQQKRGKWSRIAESLDNGRTGKQCRERWTNHLRPDLKKGNWTKEEDEKIYHYQQKFGNQWSKIAPYLPGRTDNDIKNRWHAGMRSNRNVCTVPSRKFSSFRRLGFDNTNQPVTSTNLGSYVDELMKNSELLTPIEASAKKAKYNHTTTAAVSPKALEVVMNLNGGASAKKIKKLTSMNGMVPPEIKYDPSGEQKPVDSLTFSRVSPLSSLPSTSLGSPMEQDHIFKEIKKEDGARPSLSPDISRHPYASHFTFEEV